MAYFGRPTGRIHQCWKDHVELPKHRGGNGTDTFSGLEVAFLLGGRPHSDCWELMYLRDFRALCPHGCSLSLALHLRATLRSLLVFQLGSVPLTLQSALLDSARDTLLGSRALSSLHCPSSEWAAASSCVFSPGRWGCLLHLGAGDPAAQAAQAESPGWERPRLHEL